MKALLRFQFFFLILTSVVTFADPPDWSVNPSNFQFNSTVTAVLYVNDTLAQNGNTVGAFVGNEVRGVATPIQVGDSWMYFMTVYSNAASGETVIFKAYIANSDMTGDISETIPFTANSITGSPASPFVWHLYIDYDFAPVLSGIPDQTIEVGGSFTTFDLDDYLTTFDSDGIIWSNSGNSQLNVTITPNHVVTVTAPNGFTGNEALIFTVTDNSAHQYAASDTAVFTVFPLDIPPQVNDIPNQTIGIGGAFTQFDLDNYLTLSDADQVAWSYQFQTSVVGTPAPTWSVNPSAFQFSMNMTVHVTSRGASLTGTNHILAGFAGSDVRGVTQSVAVSDGFLFFITLYANTQGEDISFRLYDAATQEILPVLEHISFSPNAVVGEPAHPYPLSAGNIHFLLDGNNSIVATVVDPTWVGSEQVFFTATDVGSLHSYSDSDGMTFTVMNDHTPLVSGIADQTIEQGQSFTSFGNVECFRKYESSGVH